VAVAPQAHDAAADFVVRRYEQQLLDAGHDYVLVQAILPLAAAPAHADATLAELTKRVGETDFQRVVTAMQRIRRLVPAATPATYDPALFDDPAEQALHEALSKVRDALGGQAGELGTFADAAAMLVEPIDTYFTDVLVMTDDPIVRANRLGHLAAIRDLADPVINWDVLP
jgi:glycyl-tRNA synthetase